MRKLALAIPLALSGMAAALAGCSSGPDRAASMVETGVGFGNYQQYLRERERTRGSAPYSVPPETTRAPQVGAAPLPPVPALPVPAGAPLSPPINTQALAPVGSTAAPMQAPMHMGSSAPVNAIPATLATPASVPDAPPRTVRDAQIYQGEGSPAHRGGGAGPAPAQIVAVTSVPPPASGGPNLMAYALANTHPVGTEIHRRLNPLRWSRWENACLQYRNQDLAQIAFLEDGGPERDRNNLDPDGDGYACWWDPAPLRRAVAPSRG